MKKKAIASFLNGLWPGVGYYYIDYKKEGMYAMIGSLVLAIILMSIALYYPNILFIGIVINFVAGMHILIMNNSFVKADDVVLDDYIKDTLKTISSRIDHLYDQYTVLEAKVGRDNRKLENLRRHLKSVKIHYDAARKAMSKNDGHTATEEATFAYKLTTNIQITINRLKQEFADFDILA